MCLYIGAGIAANIGTLIWHIKGRKRKDVYSLGASGALMGLNLYLALKSCCKEGPDNTSSEDEMDEEEHSGKDWRKMCKMILKTAAPDVLILLPALQLLSNGAEDI